VQVFLLEFSFHFLAWLISSTSEALEIRSCANERVKMVLKLWPIKSFIINHLVALAPILVKFPKLSKLKFGSIKDLGFAGNGINFVPEI